MLTPYPVSEPASCVSDTSPNQMFPKSRKPFFQMTLYSLIERRISTQKSKEYWQLEIELLRLLELFYKYPIAIINLKA
jgi:hypothetical protein